MSKPWLGVFVWSCLGSLTYTGIFEDSDIPIDLVQIQGGGPKRTKEIGQQIQTYYKVPHHSLSYTVLPSRRHTEKTMEMKPRRGTVPVRTVSRTRSDNPSIPKITLLYMSHSTHPKLPTLILIELAAPPPRNYCQTL